MREIKFRALNLSGEKFYGYLVIDYNNRHYITQPLKNGHYLVEVDPETVGQYIGLKDVNNTEIYEGDIVKVIDFSDDYTLHQIEYCAEKWDYPAFELVPDLGVGSNGIAHCIASDEEDIEVIGNIHENPELLEGE
jgi:uncharacterized phage protein (TIGR01671 family)